MSRPTSALVIGGGIAGPVTAAALRLAGIDARVHEARPVPSSIGGSLALAANGLAALDVLGAGDAVRAIGLPIPESRMTVADRDLGRLPALEGVEPIRIVRRDALHRVLHDHAVEAGVPIEHGKRLVAVDDGPGGVVARFDDGTEERADVLVGADGVRSTVRRLIDPDAPGPRYTGLLGFEGRVDSPPDDFDGMTFAFGRRAYYLYWPEPDSTVTWGANLPSKHYLGLREARAVPSDEWLAELRRTYADDRPGADLAARTTAATLDVTGAIHIMPPVPHWSRGRMVLVGDAVHAPSNSTGQGASLAIESGIELARCLRDAEDATAAFAAYESLRRPRVERVARRGARINSAKAPGPVARGVMRLVMPLALRAMDTEKALGPEQRYRIDWKAPAVQG